MRIEEGVRLDYADVLIKPKRSRLFSRSEVELAREFKFPHSTKTWTGVPIIASNMDTIGTFPVASIFESHSMLTSIHKHYSIMEWERWTRTTDWYNIIPSTGIREGDWKKISQIYNTISNKLLRFVCLDVANGYSEMFVTHVEMMRKELPDVIIIAGNVATPEMTEQLILSGADIVKVGIGPGSACTTRRITGVGIPQLSAVMECADAAHGLNGHIIADGGCSTPGDVAKAFSAGADFVMLGGMLAGHDETGTEFYGMSSEIAQEKYNGGVADYRASEGKIVEVSSRGPLENTIQQILGGLRSCCTYIGAESLKHMPKCATFIQVNR